MASKKDREILFNKYGGKCAYCGEDLQKGWHVDEILPVVRKWKWTKCGYYHKTTGEPKPKDVIVRLNPDYIWKDSKQVSDGMEYPERMCIQNQNPSCASCNINKHSGSLEDFRSLIQGFINPLSKKWTPQKRLVGDISITSSNYGKSFAAPTQSLLQKWLREEHNLHLAIDTSINGFCCYMGVQEIGKVKDHTKSHWIWDKSGRKGISKEAETFKTYELALEKGLQFALKLIKQ